MILFVIVESKEPDCDAVSGKICNNEAVFLKRLQVLLHLKMSGRRSPDASERRRPPSVSGAKRPRQDDDNGILAEIERAGAMHAAFRNGVKVATNNERNAGRHCRDSPHEPIVLLEPAALPIRLRNVRRELSVPAEDVRVPLAPFAGAPAGRVRGDVDDVYDV